MEPRANLKTREAKSADFEFQSIGLVSFSNIFFEFKQSLEDFALLFLKNFLIELFKKEDLGYLKLKLN
jgi:hypothetical protein